MNFWDYLIILAVAAAVIAALIGIRAKRREGGVCAGCCADCAGCQGGKKTGTDRE